MSKDTRCNNCQSKYKVTDIYKSKPADDVACDYHSFLQFWGQTGGRRTADAESDADFHRRTRCLTTRVAYSNTRRVPVAHRLSEQN